MGLANVRCLSVYWLPSRSAYATLVGRVRNGSRTMDKYPVGQDLPCTLRSVMALSWLVLIFSGVCESVWAIAFDRSEGFSRIVPTVIFTVGLAASMGGLAYAMKHIPLGTSYAIWVGIGASITAVYGMINGEEAVSLLRILLIGGLVACVIGLKLID